MINHLVHDAQAGSGIQEIKIKHGILHPAKLGQETQMVFFKELHLEKLGADRSETAWQAVIRTVQQPQANPLLIHDVQCLPAGPPVSVWYGGIGQVLLISHVQDIRTVFPQYGCRT